LLKNYVSAFDALFANNNINSGDKTGIDHDQFSFGLKKSLFNFMHGICFDHKLQKFFDFKIPKTKILPDFISNALGETEDLDCSFLAMTNQLPKLFG
jgi:hypothetical protein